MTQIKLINIHKSFGACEIIKGIDLEIASGEFMVIIGPSGCGKSTLLRMIAGLEEITAGTLSFDGRIVNNLTPPRRGIAMVFQSYALYPHMTVYQNMSFGLKLAKNGRAEIHRRVRDAAELLQITAYLDKLPRVLSGGQRQRVAIGRAIVRDPDVFLFDEPLSNLDASLRVAMRVEIAKLKQRMAKTTMIYVTHDQVEAMTLADRVCILRDGKVEQVGTPAELYGQPQTMFVACFIGSPKMNILNGNFAAAYGAHAIGVRPEHLVVSPVPAQWSGKIIMRENLGAESYLYVDIGAGEPLVLRDDMGVSGSSAATNNLLHIALKREDLLYRFDKNGLLLKKKHH